jgi:transposase
MASNPEIKTTYQGRAVGVTIPASVAFDLGSFQKMVGVAYEVVPRLDRRFVVQPGRLVVERTFVWLGKYRRLIKDAFARTMSSWRKLAKPLSMWRPFISLSVA